MMIWAKGTSSSTFSVAAMPSMSGMLMSIRTTCGWVCLERVMPSFPVRAAPQTSRSDSNCSNLRMLSRVSAKSSTIRTRILVATALSLSRYSVPGKFRNEELVGEIGLAVRQLGRQRDIALCDQALQIPARQVEDGGIARGTQGKGEIAARLHDQVERQGFTRRNLQHHDVRSGRYAAHRRGLSLWRTHALGRDHLCGALALDRAHRQHACIRDDDRADGARAPGFAGHVVSRQHGIREGRLREVAPALHRHHFDLAFRGYREHLNLVGHRGLEIWIEIEEEQCDDHRDVIAAL